VLRLEIVGREALAADVAVPLARLGATAGAARLGSRVVDCTVRVLEPDHLRANKGSVNRLTKAV
jgi:hypothetical protein